MVKSLNLRDIEREHMTNNCDLSVDQNGQEILIGLSREESEWMLWYKREYSLGSGRHPAPEEKKRHIALVEKHERARLPTILLAKSEAGGNA